MKSEDSDVVELIFILMAVIVGMIMVVNSVSAFPYQLNLTDGTIVDLDSSNNFNGTLDIISNGSGLYIVERNPINYTISNIANTYQNITQNITYVNMTCLNCTNYYNQTINNSYFDYGYNKSDLNSNFVTLSDYNSWKSGLSYATKDELTNQFNNLNATITKPSDFNSHAWIWWSILLIALAELGITGFIIYMTRGLE